MTDSLDLASRTGLPDALRVLVESYPRTGWTTDPGFNDLISFWLDRHVMFRRLMTELTSGTQALLDRSADPQRLAAGLSRYGGMFVNQLHGHHQIEDAHYFPVLASRDPRIARGFDILDADHHALDAELDRFVTAANGTLSTLADRPALQDAAANFLTQLERLEKLLDRHLQDEEDLVVPVILRYGTAGLG